MRRWLGLFLVVVAVSACGDDGGSPNTDAACLDGNGEPIGDDCDDSDADRFPGNEEVCDDHDPTAIGYLDADGVISNQCCNPVPAGRPSAVATATTRTALATTRRSSAATT